MKLNKIKFVNSNIIDSDYFNTDLRDSSFLSSGLKNTNFLNSDLRKANFKDAKNYIINPLSNKIEKAIFFFTRSNVTIN